MTKKELFRKVTDYVHLDENESLTNLDEVYLVTNPKRDGAFFLIVKKDCKYICVGNWLHNCEIISTVAVISAKFECTLISPFELKLAIVIDDDNVSIYTDWGK